MRFVQDYTQGRPTKGRSGKKRGEGLESGVTGDVESRYKKMYEDDINPFTAFSKTEKERRFKELGIRDKITLTSGRFLLGNKYAWTFIFFYSIGLHLLYSIPFQLCPNFSKLFGVSTKTTSLHNYKKGVLLRNCNIFVTSL